MDAEAKYRRKEMHGLVEAPSKSSDILENACRQRLGLQVHNSLNDLDPCPRPSKRQRRCKAASTASLDAPRLPMRGQHRLLTKIQEIMEHACYEFASNMMPEVIEEKGWDCPECVELNMWPQLLQRHEHRFSSESLAVLGKPLREVLESMSHLRHTVVHRTRVPATKVKHFMTEAETIVKLLGITDSGASLVRLKQMTDPVLEDFIQSTSMIAASLAEEREAIASARAQLDRREEAIAAGILRKGLEQEAVVGSALKQAIDSMEHN